MVMTKQPALDKTKAQALISEFLDKFQEVVNSKNPPKAAALESVLADNFQLTNNAKVEASGLADYIKRLSLYQKKFNSIDLTDLVEDPIFAEHQVVVQYDANLNGRDGWKSVVRILAIATIESNKIVSWVQVAHEKGTSQWDL